MGIKNFKFLSKIEPTFLREEDVTIPPLRSDEWWNDRDIVEAINRQNVERQQNQNIQRVRDELHIDDYAADNFTNRNDFMMHLRRQQASRIVEKLLENNLIDHTFTRSDANNYSISRMEIRVQSPDV